MVGNDKLTFNIDNILFKEKCVYLHFINVRIVILISLIDIILRFFLCRI